MSGVNKANKFFDTRKFMERMCKDVVIKQEITYECHDHVNFGTAEVYRDPGSENLSKGGAGFVQTHSTAFNSEYRR